MSKTGSIRSTDVGRGTPSFYSSFVTNLLRAGDSLSSSHYYQALIAEQQPNRAMPVLLPRNVPSKKRGIGHPISSPLHPHLRRNGCAPICGAL
jgi:hypothetical protein